jgi:DNA-binding CsgD family transcriptional regulator
MPALTHLGLTEDSDLLYRNLLRRNGAVIADWAHLLQWSTGRLLAAAEPLVRQGLIQARPGGFVAQDPHETLAGLIDSESVRLARDRRALEELVVLVGEYSQIYSSFQHDPHSGAIRHITPSQLPDTIAEAVAATQGPIRTMQLTLQQGPVADEGISPLALAALQSQRALRALYLPAVLEDAEQLEWVRQWAELGQTQRLSATLAGHFLIFDDELVIAAERWGEPAASAVQMRVPVAVAAFSRLFDDAWAQALPRPESGPADVDQQLLSLLARGFKDEAIARYMRIGVRTVRRRVAELMAELNVQTRYQLGASVQQRGLAAAGR